MGGRFVPGAGERDRGRGDRSSVILREGTQGELDVVVSDPVGAESAGRAVPGGDAVEGGEDEGRGDRGVGRPEGPDRDAVADRLAKAGFVRIAARGDGAAAVRGEV